MALLLLLLTAVGPLLAWRRTSIESIRRNFLWPSLGALAVGVFLLLTPESWGSVFGLKPWQDIAYLYSLMAIMLSALVGLTVISEFLRGGRVIAKHTGQNLLASMVQLGHRNTRRYGGYIVHFGVIIVVIGFAGWAFNQENEHEMDFRRPDESRLLHLGLPLLHPGRESELRQRVGDHGCFQGRQADRHDVP